MLDSPFEYCVVCRDYVLLDQTQRECAREHACSRRECPLHRFFTGIDFAAPPGPPAKPPRAQRKG